MFIIVIRGRRNRSVLRIGIITEAEDTVISYVTLIFMLDRLALSGMEVHEICEAKQHSLFIRSCKM